MELCVWLRGRLWLRLPTTKPGGQEEAGPAILLPLLLLRLAMVVVAWAVCVHSEAMAAKRTVMLAAQNREAGRCLDRLGAAIVGSCRPNSPVGLVCVCDVMCRDR